MVNLENTIDNLENTIKIQMRRAFFDKLAKDFNETPPNTNHISKLVSELSDALCKFVPSKTKIHERIKKDLLLDNISLNTMPNIVMSLIKWIRMFQAPIHDKKTDLWKKQFTECENCTNFLIEFLKEYYNHLELLHKEVYEARKRLANGESAIPLEHRNVVNNLADIKFKTGRSL